MSEPKTKLPTIADVAKLAGVSMMTVSRVLNDSNNVKQVTREKIEHAVKTLGYKPNFSARKLSGGKNFFIGVLCFQPNSAYVSQFLFGCIRHCSEIGYHLIVEECNQDTHIEEMIDAITKDVDGMILLPPVSENPLVLRALDKKSIPYVKVGQLVEPGRNSAISAITINDYQAAFELTEHLIEYGHSHIGFITGDKKQWVSAERQQGYQDALEKHGIALKQDYIQEGDFTYKSALVAAENLMTLPVRPSAIFASNDDMAAATIAIANRHHLNVPEDISIVGFDDASTATMVWPQLTTVKQPLQQMAVHAVTRLLNQDSEDMMSMPFEIVFRDSVARH